ncbi:hypothetical protein DL95DRAFT_461120 [Leptodontidium sp. 2 PMI_412]|nr:hypothetical protein DL95DRAFT_461120 [Leptodontidium sp. 2 PMI_412]
MFDVSWVDPARETVGERTIRKNTERQRSGRHLNNETRNRNRTPQEGSLRSSIPSDAAAKTSHWEIPGKSSVPKWIQSRSYIQHSLHDTTYNEQFSAASIQSDSSAWSTDSDLLEYLHSEAQRNASTENTRPPTILHPGIVLDPIETDRASSARSSWSGSSVTDSLAPCSRTNSFVVQPLSPRSFISRSVDVTVGPRDSIENGNYVTTSVVSISAAGSPSRRGQGESSELEHSQSSAKRSPPSLAFDPSSPPFSEDSPRRDKPRLLELSHSPLKRDLSLAPRDISQPTSFGSSPNPRLIPSQEQSTTKPTSRGHPRGRSPAIPQIWEAPETWECSTRSSESSKSPPTPVFCTDHPLLHNSPSHSPQQLTGGNSDWDSSSMATEFQHIRCAP